MGDMYLDSARTWTDRAPRVLLRTFDKISAPSRPAWGAPQASVSARADAQASNLAQTRLQREVATCITEVEKLAADLALMREEIGFRRTLFRAQMVRALELVEASAPTCGANGST
mmetsp:Transcript_12152/g.30933  ORF Transcript_12152/g.30933 Transcript_12152/m.30933 type:complete len:115 (+) Transcript_12152:55-399(+)